ncbi:MAG: hypothetical protein E7E64_16095 [Clostridium celatum]|uniref:hypothetical protein n=1 Tax=Clostridia TaxID=186801 RepID=UPI00115772D3|nr:MULTISPECIES: hypothetical protein [Clostridia]MDU0875823.1 hypothetical protein [Actinomyces urogenitalis]MDU1476645.1 hypothetical protein [Clostridium perfringens]MDU2124030.1 hypothetical protein [Clostridium celatum]MDB1971457.1 hypothetical protein [Clostridium tertium]MDU1280432.1 hypothetical protein [Clostridium sp.]
MKKLLISIVTLSFVISLPLTSVVASSKEGNNKNTKKEINLETKNIKEVEDYIGLSYDSVKDKVQTRHNIENKKELKDFKNYQLGFLKENKDEREGNVTLTFARPISVEEFNKIARKNSFLVLDYETKHITSTGEWITGFLQKLDENEVSALNEEIKHNINDSDTKYEGITSARVSMKLNGNKYDKLSKDELIYLADITDYLVKKENNNYDLKVMVPDIYWEIDNIK